MTALTRSPEGAKASPAYPEPRQMPTAVAMVPSIPAWPRLEWTTRPSSVGTTRSKARTGLEAPRTRGPLVEAATARARSSIVRPEPAASTESMRSPASRAASRTREAHSA